MKRILIAVGVVVLLAGAAFAVVWFVPSVQDAIIKRGMVAGLNRANSQPFLKDKALHILLCGTGSPMPDLTRGNACVAVIAGGHVVIIDAGPGSWARIAAAGIPGASIDTVLLTHLHSDHIGDLGEVATQSWLGGRSVPLDVYGPPAPQAAEQVTNAEGDVLGHAGTEDVVKGFAQAYGTDADFRIAQGHDLVPTEAARMIGHDIARPGPEEAVTVYDRDGLKIEAFLVNHDPVEPAYGYRISYGGRVAVISGDTARADNMVRFAQGADLLVHEALNSRHGRDAGSGARPDRQPPRRHHGAPGRGLSHDAGASRGHRQGGGRAASRADPRGAAAQERADAAYVRARRGRRARAMATRRSAMTGCCSRCPPTPRTSSTKRLF